MPQFNISLFLLNSALIFFLTFYLYLLLTNNSKFTLTKIKWTSLCFFLVLILGFFLFPCPWGVFKVDLDLNFGFFQSYSLIYHLYLAACTYKYSSKNWQVLYAVVAYSYISIFLIFFSTENQTSYLALGFIFIFSCVLNSVVWCGGITAWSRFVAESYLKETHTPLSFLSFSQLWVNYLDKVHPVKKKALSDRNLSIINATYTWNMFLNLVFYAIAYPFFGFLFLGFYLKTAQWGVFTLYFIVPLFSLHLLTFDPVWKANFEDAFGEKSLHRLGYNGQLISLARRGDPAAVTAVAATVTAIAAVPGGIEKLPSMPSNDLPSISTKGEVSPPAEGKGSGEVCPVDISSPSPIVQKGALITNPDGTRFTAQSTFREPTPLKDPESTKFQN